MIYGVGVRHQNPMHFSSSIENSADTLVVPDTITEAQAPRRFAVPYSAGMTAWPLHIFALHVTS